ncbi:outer membrane beta-barrel protein [candidate division KSB1 bacterium]|nr:outer membrane beta-barrel protein [candidate division KSB1 bacterium]
MNIRGLYILLLSLVWLNSARADDSGMFDKMSIGLEFGTWKPNNLRSTETPFTISPASKYFYFGSSVMSPISGNLQLRTTLGYFNYHKNDETSRKKTVCLIPVLADLKYLLISDSRLSPYVSYGAGLYIGDDRFSQIFSSSEDKNTAIGYGLNFGTGFDLLITENWAAGLEFRYHYLRFSDVLIFTEDYSGPKINMTVFYLF